MNSVGDLDGFGLSSELHPAVGERVSQDGNDAWRVGPSSSSSTQGRRHLGREGRRGAQPPRRSS